VTREGLNFHSCVSSPKSTGLIDGGRDDSVSLGVELNFTDFILMTLQKCHTGTSEHVVYTGYSIGTSCRHFVSCRVEARV